MTEYRVKRPLQRPAVHPGEILREDVLPALELSTGAAAKRLGVSRQQLHRVLACTHPVSVEMALRIGRLVGNGPGLWLRMQQNHDLRHAERRLKDELEKIVPAETPPPAPAAPAA
ncbi:MAG: HigA family addiction module antidote protein [Alphaproteobacteria bacterium]|nr:HigA family addiction module antidote protein [Alphaproteobacteria bacterium]